MNTTITSMLEHTGFKGRNGAELLYVEDPAAPEDAPTIFWCPTHEEQLLLTEVDGPSYGGSHEYFMTLECGCGFSYCTF